MNYEETLEYLYSQMPEYQRVGHKAYKEGLDNSLALDDYFQHPHQRYNTIHVGGTNGKGSTSHLLAAILQESGYKVGLYTSPHLVDFRERIRVNGKMIDKQYVVDFVEKYRSAFEPIMPSFFELTMEMAFLYFAEQKIDIAVVEVGLGGRLDSTNIISPKLSIITNIGLDHTQYLGDTLKKIASEKAGIIKPNTPVVIGETGDVEVAQVFYIKAQKEKAPIIFAEEAMFDLVSQKTENGWIFSKSDFPILKDELGGLAQEKNAKTVLTSIVELRKSGFYIPEDAVYNGFAHVVELTGLMGRWQVLQENPKIICDTGHNAHGIRYIAEQLKSESYDKLHIVFGMVNDKDINSVLALMPKGASYYFTKASIERALDENILADEALRYDLHGTRYSTVESAIESAKEKAGENDMIFIGGSSFIVAEALPLFINTKNR
ncbi:MAG: folylpolyglutamate synthase/dihydrofolate synthase family protein [Dysgonamonadaceae bacterium]|jgi:dihydrofolate synthase/folylpolyglutamate synthase|nr:bifunctional folylpolyglutamate synthase/dihydrofolate synthase [Dysgonamonadaceae bacterium]MDD3901517.1 bifunctional folylpolyglutamate synthase/dihydrofolate synthase [Dysgonamonadaceae bacterium]MDD4399567.1 bifunctional folylpolyglutamate synthase/dihydrofolate synthase [Dysgonamonadaceae bacterium]MEA5082404.1 folylpolyglutamate synthase/dihydrofolate synthase family protein [Dysgonamonadaceae bacterium]